VAGINPYVTCDGITYFLIGKEIETLKWSGFTGGYEDKDQTIVNTAIREFMEESCNIFLPWKKEVYNRILNDQCILVKGKSARRREIFTWFVEFPSDLKEQQLENRFQGNRTKMYSAHYLEKEKIKWVSENDIFNENLSKGFRKDVKSFLNKQIKQHSLGR